MQNCRGFVAIIRDRVLREIWRQTYEGLHVWRNATPVMSSVCGNGWRRRARNGWQMFDKLISEVCVDN
jgi:hypothetical protein